MQDQQSDPSADIDALAPRFEALGLTDVAARLRALGQSPAATRWALPPVPADLGPDEVLTATAAAQALGLRSVSLVITMAQVGTLEAFTEGDEILLSRRSVEQYSHRPTAKLQRRLEEQLYSILGEADEL